MGPTKHACAKCKKHKSKMVKVILKTGRPINYCSKCAMEKELRER